MEGLKGRLACCSSLWFLCVAQRDCRVVVVSRYGQPGVTPHIGHGHDGRVPGSPLVGTHSFRTLGAGVPAPVFWLLCSLTGVSNGGRWSGPSLVETRPQKLRNPDLQSPTLGCRLLVRRLDTSKYGKDTWMSTV